MFETFLKANSLDSSVRNVRTRAAQTLEATAPDVYKLLSQLGGKSFGNGLYRVHTFSSGLYWTKQLLEYFPNYPNVYTFAFDWAGCTYAAGQKGRKTMLYLFDPSNLQAYELQQNIIEFHNEDLVLYRDETLLTKKFKTALNHCELTSLPFDKCLGYKQSLFLGGKDTAKNRSVWSVKVYWELQNQLFEAVED